MTTSPTPEIEIDAVERDSRTVYDVSYGRTHRATVVVVTAVATVDGREPADLRPLHDVVDTDALDRLVDGAWQRASAASVAFTYEGYDVEFREPGRARLERTA